MYHPTLQDVKSIINRLNKDRNMNVVIINEGQLKFALQKPEMTLFGRKQYPELYQKAAVLMESIVKLHTLNDGNKRTAMMAAEFMIRANGGELILPLKAIRLSVDTAMDEGDSMSELIQQWFKVHIAMNTYDLCAILYESVEEESIIKNLLDSQRYGEADDLVGRWMAFDSYPENKKKWDEIIKRLQDNPRPKSHHRSKKHAYSDTWQSIMTMAGRICEEHVDYFPISVKEVQDLKCHKNSMEELKSMENKILHDTKEYAETVNPETIHQNAMMLERHREYAKSINEFEKLQRHAKHGYNPDSHIAQIHYYRLYDPKSALRHWKICEKNTPDSYYTMSIGFALTDLGEYANALNYLENALEKEKPHIARILMFKGMCNAGLRKHETAIECYEKSMELDPQNPETWHLLTVSCSETHRLEKALEYHDKIIKLNPDDFLGYYSKGVSLHHEGRYAEAITEYETSLRLNPDHIESVINMGSALFNSGKGLDAIPFLNEALGQDPVHPVALQALRETLMRLKKFDESLTYIERLLRINPDDHNVKLDKAAVFANTERILDSLTLLEETVRDNPDCKDVLRENSDGLFDPIVSSERFKRLVR